MRISIFSGDLCDAPADAICTSTNPRLSLVMGTGSSVRERGGYRILRECEAIAEEGFRRTGQRGLTPGSVHITSAGDLQAKVVIHCVASDSSHHSSADTIRNCVRNALSAAGAAGCSSIAMPVFGTGHARFRFDQALRVIAEALSSPPSSILEVLIVVRDQARANEAAELMRKLLPSVSIEIVEGPDSDTEDADSWGSVWGGSQ